jgi:hypothetical protein
MRRAFKRCVVLGERSEAPPAVAPQTVHCTDLINAASPTELLVFPPPADDDSLSPSPGTNKSSRKPLYQMKPDQGGSPDVTISPDVVSFIRDRLGDCDLRCGGGTRDVAREASSISLATGIAGLERLLLCVPSCRFHRCCPVGSSLMKRRRLHDQFRESPPSSRCKLQEKRASGSGSR